LLVDGFLEATASRTPDGLALVCGASRLTFAELDCGVSRVAAGLARLGVSRGDRVVMHLENSVEAVLGIFGSLRAGAVIVPVNPTTKSEKLAHILRDCEPTAVISTERAAQVLSNALDRVARHPGVILTGATPESLQQSQLKSAVAFDDLLTGAPQPSRLRQIDLELAALIYTSGSTGRPKGVMLSHGNIVAATSSIDRYLQNSSSDVILNVLPLSFDYGLYQLFLASYAGASVVLERSFAYPALLLELMARERVTALPIVPMIAALLLRYDLGATDLSSLRYITNTGAVLPPAHIEALRHRLPHVRVFSMYGLTECKRVSFLAPDEIDKRPTSVGKPMDNVEVFLVDSEGSRLDHGVGELVVRGANVMQGYWRAPEDTARVLRPGLLPGERVLHTGDIFRIDEDGFMHFQHRLDDVIKSRGQKVSPREVEDVLHAVPGVVEALVVGVPDAILGVAVKGYVTVAPGVLTSEREILSHCAKHLEDFMLPRSIEIVSELPHNDSGKLARGFLQTSLETSAVASQRVADADARLVAWRHSMARNVILLAAVGLAILFAHRQALAAMLELWQASPMYSYAFTVPVISGYLLWTRRAELSRLTPRPSLLAGAALMLLSVTMVTAARAAGVQVLDQLAFLVSLTAAVMLLFGFAYVKVAWAALAYLLLMIPIWDGLTESLHGPFQLRSAEIGTWLLQNIGVPAHREGTTIALSNLTIEVARACSGVNYLVAVTALGLPAAYLYLPAWWRRVALLLAALVVAALSNGLRVALIGLLAYLEIGSPLHGPFHVLHGLFVAGVGYAVLFVGLRLLTPQPHIETAQTVGPSSLRLRTAAAGSGPFVSTISTLVATTLFVFVGLNVFSRAPRAVALAGDLDAFPTQLGQWALVLGSTTRPIAAPPNWVGVDSEIRRRYTRSDGATADVYVGYFASQSQGREVVNDHVTSLHERASRVRLSTPGGVFDVNYVPADPHGIETLFWYDLGNGPETNRFLVKARTLWSAMTSGETSAAVVVLMSKHESEQVPPALQELAVFVEAAVAPRLSGNRQTADLRDPKPQNWFTRNVKDERPVISATGRHTLSRGREDATQRSEQ
jgi:EpsI family protein